MFPPPTEPCMEERKLRIESGFDLRYFLSVSLELCWSLEIVTTKYRSFFKYLKQIFSFCFNM